MSLSADLPIALTPRIWELFWAALPIKQAASDATMQQLSQECPWLYGFACGVKAQGDSLLQFRVKLAQAATIPKVAIALQDARLPLERFLLADLDRRWAAVPQLWEKVAVGGFGIGGPKVPGYSVPATPKPAAPTAKTAPAPQVGTSRLNTYQSLPAAELPKYQQRFSTPGNTAWGESWRQNYAQRMQTAQPGATPRYNPYYQQPQPNQQPVDPQAQQSRLQTDYWLNGKLPEGTPAPADLSTWRQGSPEDVKRFQWVAERSGLDPHTLMQGFQAEQQLAAAAPNNSRAEVVSALEQLPADQRAALRAWQWAQQTDNELYRGEGYGQGRLMKGVDPGEDSPLWAATLNDQVRQRLANDPQALQTYVGQPEDWDGLEGLAKRWGVDVREKPFQDFWQQEGEKVKARGWGHAPQSVDATASGPEELMRRYARWKSRELGLLDSVQQSQEPTSFAQRFFGFRRQTSQGEVPTVASASENTFGPGFWNNVAGHAKGIGRTALSGIGAPGAVLVDALRGDTDATYSKMMARDLMRYTNDLMGTDIGHNVEMQRPDGATLAQPQAPGETRPIPQTSGNFGFWTGSAAPDWAQRQGLSGDVGQMQAKGDYLKSYGERADVPWYERIGARGMGNTYNNVEVPLEFAATGGLAGGVGKALGTAGRAMPGGAALFGKELELAGAAANTAQKPLNAMAQMTGILGNPAAQTGAAAFGEIPIGGGERIMDKQRALAQASREWGAAPDAGLLQNLTGNVLANTAETGPLALAGGARSLLKPTGLAGATGRAVGQRSLSPLLQEGAGLNMLAKQTLRSPVMTLGTAGAVAPSLGAQLDGSEWRQTHVRQQLAAQYPEALRLDPETGALSYQRDTWKPALTGEGTWQSRQQDLAKQLAQASPTHTPGLFNVSEEALQQAGPDGQAQVGQAASQVTEAAKQLGPEGYARLQKDLTSGDPNTPGVSTALQNFQQQTGLPLNDAWQSFQQMDPGSQLMLGMGVALGTVGLLAALTSENGTLGFLTSVLGFGAATGALANEGVFGEHAQQFTKGILDLVGGGGAQQKQQQPGAAAPPAAAPVKLQDDPAASLQQMLQDKRLSATELQAMMGDDKLRSHVFGLDDPQALDVLRAAASGDKQMGDRLRAIKQHRGTYGTAIADALAKPSDQQTRVGPPLIGQNVPGMNLTPEQARRLIELAGKL